MNRFKHFIGIDISKDYFDATILDGLNKSSHNQFDNSRKGITQLLKWMKQKSCSIDTALICMEYTGTNTQILIDVLLENSCFIWVEMSYRIIRSSGIQRGKNDKIDSERIALYAKKNQEDAKLFEPSEKALDSIKALLGRREMLLSQRSDLKVSIEEMKLFDKDLYKSLIKNSTEIIKVYDEVLKDFDIRLEELINESQRDRE